MRCLILLLVVVAACGGCKTAEFAVQHPVTGLHVVARFAAQDQQPGQQQPLPLPFTCENAACMQHAGVQPPHRLPAPLGS